MAEPKRFQCLECGSKSNRSKTLKLGGIGFARCYKCGGRVKETEEWLKQHYEFQKEWMKSLNS